MNGLNSQPNGQGADGLWLTVSDLARAKGLAKSAVSQRLAKFEAEGLVTSKPGTRNSKLVNAAEYDRACGEIGDTLRTVVAATPTEPQEPADPSSASILTAERARHQGYTAELARLELEERQRRLLVTDDVIAAEQLCAEAIVREVERLPTHADRLASAVARDGAHGARLVLREIAFEMRSGMERAILALAAPRVATEAA